MTYKFIHNLSKIRKVFTFAIIHFNYFKLSRLNILKQSRPLTTEFIAVFSNILNGIYKIKYFVPSCVSQS